MERVKPETFKGPRAYFTTLDPRIVVRVQNREELRRDIERRLKILLLTKNTVVCAASHLASDFAYVLFRDNPILLKKGLIVPALRLDRSDIGDVLDTGTVSPSRKSEMIDFYRSQILRTVDWELEENSAWFRNSFLRELKNEQSLLRKNLAKLSNEQLEWVTGEIESEPLLDTDKVDLIASRLDVEERQVLLNFRDLIYHISGARVVNCESTLPQENYIDYSLADIEHRKIMLSELQIFWKIFLELALETLHKQMIPLELLDLLTFEDICELRRPIEDSTFGEIYDFLIRKSVDSVAKEEQKSVLFDVEEILAIKDRLSENFAEVFERELKAFPKRKALVSARALGKNTISVGLGVAGFFPIISNITAIIGLLKETPAFWLNLTQTFRDIKSINDYEEYLRAKEMAIKSTIRKSEVSDKSQLLDVVDLVMKTISSRITL